MLGARDDSLHYHLVKRVVVERQWAWGTTAAQYLEDLRAAILSRGSGLALYRRRGGSLAAVVAVTASVVPGERLGPNSVANLIAIYSADRDILVTGYQLSRLEAAVPGDALWLR